jgi:hypothetical protein
VGDRVDQQGRTKHTEITVPAAHSVTTEFVPEPVTGQTRQPADGLSLAGVMNEPRGQVGTVQPGAGPEIGFRQ